MKITVLQNQIVWADTDANIREAESMLKENRDSDMYVLPEMWSTGYDVCPCKLAAGVTPQDNTALEWMMDAAGRYACAIVGSMVVKDGDSFRNRLYFVHPDGHTDYYDKHHLFSMGGEDRNYTPGEQRVIAIYKGVRFSLNICYDLRFPVWQRNFNDYDVMLIVASWPESRQLAWNTLLRARAIENQCFVVGCNRIGDDGSVRYAGGSAVIDAFGNYLATADSGEKEAVTATIEMDDLYTFRKKFPVLREADKIEINKNITI